jgi:hypothetical protein
VRLAEGGRHLVAERYSQERSINAWLECLQRVHKKVSLKVVPAQPALVSGRLDRVFGPRNGERIRSALARQYLYRERAASGRIPAALWRRMTPTSGRGHARKTKCPNLTMVQVRSRSCERRRPPGLLRAVSRRSIGVAPAHCCC